MSCHHLTVIEAQRTVTALDLDDVRVIRQGVLWKASAVFWTGEVIAAVDTSWADALQVVLQRAMQKQAEEHKRRRTAEGMQ